VSYILMHMRGTPETMASSPHTDYGPQGVAAAVGLELQERVVAAVASGIEPWRIITDPGKLFLTCCL
jgi:dihydropteroate synthase